MNLPRRAVYSLLSALAAAAIVFRYPLEAGHELGADTTFVHTLANSVVADGYAPWVIHPLSYFGLYALSYPSAVPFAMASSNLATDLPIEAMMLFFGWVIAIVGVLGAFLVARSIIRNDTFSLLVAALFTFSPFYIKDTFWVGSSRGFVVGLLPVFVLLCIKYMRTLRVNYLALLFAMTILMSAIHRMGFLVLFVLFALLFAIPFHKVTQRLRFALLRFERPARYALFSSAVSGFVGVFYLQFLYPGIAGANVVEQYGSGAFHGTSFLVLVGNMAVSLGGKIGPLVPFAIPGLISYVWRRPKEVVDKFVLTAFLFFVPLLSLRDYIAEFLFLFFAIFLVLGLLSFHKSLPRRRKVVSMAIAILVVASVAVSWELKDYWRERYSTDADLPTNTYTVALYIRYSTGGTIVANDGLMGGGIAAISGRPVLPLGGASLHWTSPQQLMWGYVARNSVSVQLIDLRSISFNTDSIYLAEGVRNAEVDWEALLFSTSPEEAHSALQLYDVHYVVVDNRIPAAFLSYGHDRPSPFLVLLRDSNYVIYDSPWRSIWYVG